ncbi:hypothetical protein CHS0354_004335 [Potamilus streckersoni]|uniref:WD repeat-containing protein 27 n=1 Tax=Potamilus streckersoni TaxID=2493646 RepID=A0AAE0VV75_9BIVA|nr:hypothetical protein CHS0354_004335 [Potamilus streckersoni]
MEINHVQSIRTAFTPAHFQLACDGIYLALPLTRTVIGVWSLQDLSFKPLELEGHRKILSALALGCQSSPKLLCSTAEDYVIVWNLQQARQQYQKGEKIKGHIIGTTLGHIHHLAFNPNDSLVAVCRGLEVIILESKKELIVATLEGHTALVTACEFCPHYRAILITISEDRTFKVWNLQDFSLVYQSPIVTASPFLSLAMSLQQPHVAIGTADGQVKVYDLSDGNGFRCLYSIDVGKIIRKVKEEKRISQLDSISKQGPVKISSQPAWKQSYSNQSAESADGTESMAGSVETGVSVLSLYFTYMPLEAAKRQTSASSNKPAFLQHKNSIVKDLFDAPPVLSVGTVGSLLQVNTSSLDTCCLIDLQDPILSVQGLRVETKVLNAAGIVYFAQGTDPQHIWCIIGSPFQNIVHVLKWNHASTAVKSGIPSQHSGISPASILGEDELTPLSLNEKSETDLTVWEITVLSHQPLLPDSPLQAELVPKQKPDKPHKQRGFLSTPQKGRVMADQPLTFKTKIKSSGYTEAPRMTMFKPKTNASKSQSLSRQSSRSSIASLVSRTHEKEYPMTSQVPSKLQVKLDVAERPTAINSITISDDGSSMACALANKSAQVFRFPLTGKGTSYVGHDNIVTSSYWSHDGNWLITSSDDKMAAIWGKGQADPILTFNTTNHNFGLDKEATKNDKDNQVFSRPVQNAQFYYMDKFVLLSCGYTFYLYKFHLDPTKEDVKRYHSKSKYKLVQTWATDAQQITALSAINAFYSYIVLCAGSNKSLEVYDMNAGTQIRKLTDVHTRPIHDICQNQGSAYVSHPPTAYDLFITAAAGDCIKLWDLRTNRCVKRFEGHQNRVHPCGLAVSPCGRFIASGSEDKSAYVFDMRTGTYNLKLIGHTDVVSDVAFHPLHPRLVTATLDGKIHMYTDT